VLMSKYASTLRREVKLATKLKALMMSPAPLV